MCVPRNNYSNYLIFLGTAKKRIQNTKTYCWNQLCFFLKMPTCLEHWVTMPPTTCYGYKRRYRDVETIKKQIIIHGKNAGVIISDNNDGPGLLMDDFIKASPKLLSGKRRRIQAQPVQVVIQVPDVVDGTKQPIAQVQTAEPMEQALAQTAEPMEQALAQTAEQPMADAAPVPMIEPEQPMADAAPVQTLVHTAEQLMADAAPMQKQVPVQEADAVPVQAQAPIAFSTPIFNGAHKPLVLNGLVIEVDPHTFMVNATQMCKAAGKRWNDYHENSKSTAYTFALESKTGIPVFDLIQSKPGHNGGTMVHRLIAYDLASWLSGDVKLQFYMWLDELLLTGRVELGNEMNVQQLEDAWRRINEELQAKASADVSAAQDRCQEIILQKNELELQLATIQDAHQRSDEEKNALVAIKVREDLEAAIQFQVNTTAPRIATYKEGDNVLYLARIEETKFKYGHTKNLKQRLEAHRRPGVYPTLELVWIVKSNNGVASEDQLHAYVKKKKIIAEYGTQREVIVLKSVDDLERMLKKMNKCALPRADADIDMRRMEEETKRMEITEKTKQMEINAKTKQMEINAKTMLLQMLASKTITVEQYLQIKD